MKIIPQALETARKATLLQATRQRVREAINEDTTVNVLPTCGGYLAQVAVDGELSLECFQDTFEGVLQRVNDIVSPTIPLAELERI